MTRRRDASILKVVEPVAKSGAPLPMMVSPWGQRDLRATFDSARRAHAHNAFAAGELKHNFAIRALEKKGLFTPRAYIYICVRCKQMFVVNQRRGSIAAVDRNQATLPEPEYSKQLRGFAAGPCPSFMKASKAVRRHQTTVNLGSARVPQGIFSRLVSRALGYRSGAEDDKTIAPATAITPQDLLF